MDRRVQYTMWLGLAKALPEELVSARPVLNAGLAWALLQVGEFDEAEDYLRNAERWLESTTAMSERPHAPSAEMVVVDDEEFRSLPATIAAARTYQAQALGDVPGAVKYGRLALDLLPEDDHLQRGVAAALLGLAYWASGDLETAEHTFADGMTNMRSAATSFSQSVAPIPWPISGWRKGVFMRRYTHTSSHCSLRQSRASLYCGERQTCT